MKAIDQITEAIIGCAIEVHRQVGPGLLESAYEACLCYELSQAGIRFARQHALPVEYKGVKVDCGYRVDLFIEDSVIVELKTVESLSRIHEAQLLSYLRLSGCKVGLLINFHVQLLKDGIRRIVLDLPEQ